MEKEEEASEGASFEKRIDFKNEYCWNIVVAQLRREYVLELVRVADKILRE